MSETITETEPQADVPASVPDVSDASTGGDQNETTAVVEKPEPQPERDWREKIIAAKAFENRELKRQLAELSARPQPAPQAAIQQGQQPAGYVPLSEVDARAAQLMAVAQFNEECNAIADAGEAKFADFDTATRNWQLLGGPPRPLLEAVTALGKDDGARVYYELGKDPAKAEKVLNLSPAKMAIELAKMAAAPAAPVATKAPDPIRPISAGRVASNDPANMTDEEQRAWFRKNYNPYRRRS